MFAHLYQECILTDSSYRRPHEVFCGLSRAPGCLTVCRTAMYARLQGFKGVLSVLVSRLA
jgi:hypothetical protein